jgi:hypothetical protein
MSACVGACRLKDFASRGSRGRRPADVLRLPVAFRKRQWVLHRFFDGLEEAIVGACTARLVRHKSRGPWKLIYYEAYTEREDAEGREKFLKSGAGRRLKLGRFPHSLAASLAALPSMSLIPFAPFLRAQLRHYLKRFPARAGGSVPAT